MVVSIIRKQGGKTPVLAAGASVLVLAAHVVDQNWNHIDVLANSYIGTSLAFESLTRQKQHSEEYNHHGHLILQQSLQQAASELNRRVEWSLQKHRFFPFLDASNGLTPYRLEWMRANLQSLVAQLRDDKENKLSYDEECRVIYDNPIDPTYLDPRLTKLAHEKLDALLPRHVHNKQEMALHERFHNYTTGLLIRKQDYEKVFRKLVDDVLGRSATFIPELKSAGLEQEYMDDMKESFEAFVMKTQQPRVSKMVVNVARGITYVKAQQLAVHELAHHFQQVLMEDYLYVTCPEMRLAMEMGPLGILLEGGAELFVELYYDDTKNEREIDLQSRMPPHMASRAGGVHKIVEIDRVSWFDMWPTLVQIARDFGNGKITKDDTIRRFLEDGLKPNDSWPNADFCERLGAYSHGYGYGKELIKAYCRRQADRNGSSMMEEYIAFMKQPLTPSQIKKTLPKEDMEF